MSIAERIKMARKAKGLTQTELGALIGKSGNTITNYEKGNREPDVMIIKKLSKALGVTGDWLLESDWAYEAEEQTLLKNFRTMNDEGKRTLLVMSETLANTPTYQKKEKLG